MKQALIPFGKLQGQPLEELANHKSYANWLITREDIKDKYPTVYTFIINHFRHLDDSPAHNKLQIKFSNRNRDHALKLAYFLKPDLFFWNSEKINNELKKRLNKVSKHNDVIKSKLRELKKTNLLNISPIKKEKGYDVEYSVQYGMPFSIEYEIPDRDDTFQFQLNCAKFVKILIEIKSDISEDYPSVLRQMQRSMPARHDDHSNGIVNCLLIGAYTGDTATRDEFIDYFQDEGYRVVFTSNFEHIQLPFFEDIFKLDSISDHKRIP